MKKLVIIILLAFVAIGQTEAQRLTDNAIYYHSFRSPWSNSYNPALFPASSGFYFTTAKTDVDLSLPLSYKDLNLQYDAARDVTVLNVSDFMNNLVETGFAGSFGANLNILGFGFTAKEKLHFSASAGVRIDGSFNLPMGLFDLITKGNINEDNNTLDFGADNILNVQAYGYASLSAALKLPVLPLTIGARVNVLDGLVSASADNLSVELTTADDISKMTLATDYKLHVAGIPDIASREDIANLLEEFKDIKNIDIKELLKKVSFPTNLGFTFDLGAKAKLGIIDLSVAVKDLGPGIHWTTNPITIVPKQKDVTLSFEGVELNSLLTNGRLDTSFISRYKDSLLAMIDYTTEEESYWQSMPTHLYLGASASLGKAFRVGYLFQGLWHNGWFSNHHVATNPFACNNTLSANINLVNWLEIGIANSFTYDGNNISFLNPGASLTVGFGGKFQLFAAVEYVSSIYLAEMKAAHVLFGVNVVGLRK